MRNVIDQFEDHVAADGVADQNQPHVGGDVLLDELDLVFDLSTKRKHARWVFH